MGKVLEMVAVGLLAPPATWLLCAAAFPPGLLHCPPEGFWRVRGGGAVRAEGAWFLALALAPGTSLHPPSSALCSVSHLKRAVLRGVQYLEVPRAFEVWPCLAREVR